VQCRNADHIGRRLISSVEPAGGDYSSGREFGIRDQRRGGRATDGPVCGCIRRFSGAGSVAANANTVALSN
jgi:hypothetical protein